MKKVVILLALLVFAGGFVFLLPPKLNEFSDKGNSGNSDGQSKNYSLLTSDTKAMVLVKDESLTIYDLDNDSVKTTDFSVNYGSGTIGLGNSDPLTSPNLLYSVFINKEDENLYLISHETLETYPITENGNVSFINSWSKDSSRVVFYINRDSLQSRTSGPIPDFEGQMRFEKGKDDYGFHMFKLNSGETVSLYPLDYVETFMDDINLLVKPMDSSERFVRFNTDEFYADLSAVEGDWGFGVGQYDFSNNGNYWAFTLSKNPEDTEDSNIVYAEFPNKEGTIVESGAWAELQWPKISPGNKKLSYYKSPRDSGNKEFLVIYNISSEEKEEYEVVGYPVRWLSESLILLQNTYSEVDYRYSIFNLDTEEIKNID